MTPRSFLPGRLLRAVQHAESFCQVLSRVDPQRWDVTARAWLLGRRQETACFVDQIGRDFRQGRIDENAAVRCVDAYLGALHAGLSTYFGERAPLCCRASSAVTVVAPRPTDNTPTTMYVRPRRLVPPLCPPRPEPPRPRRAGHDAATWVDVEADQLLAGLMTRR